MFRVIYNSNNSGGGWWLDDKDWLALEEVGWTVHWRKKGKISDLTDGRGHDFDTCLDKTTDYDKDVSYLGARATSAAKEFDSLEDAISEFESITGECASDEGCNCCGPPHEFSYKDMDTEKTGYGSSYVKETAFSWS